MLHRIAAALATLCLLTAAACSTSGRGAGTDPAASTPAVTTAAAPTTTPSLTPTPQATHATPSTSTVPGYLRTYNQRQRRAYKEAVAAYRHHAKVFARVMHTGKATAKAKHALQRVEFEHQWRQSFYTLQQMQNNHLHMIGQERVVWAKPTRIKLTDGSGSVTLHVCSDVSNAHVVKRNGTPIPNEGIEKGVSKVVLSRYPNKPWKLSDVKPAKKPC